MSSTPIPFKEALRCEMRGLLSAMTAVEIAAKSELIVSRLKNDGLLQKRGKVALFGGIKGEPDLLALVPWLVAHQATPVFFGFADGQLVPQRVMEASALQRGVFGVWVPPEDAEVIAPQELDIILTPGLAFGLDGTRLGRGRGFYDKLFSQPLVKAKRIGVCWKFQQLNSVPVEPHDALMDEIVTEG